jgi:hypothetical protein
MESIRPCPIQCYFLKLDSTFHPLQYLLKNPSPAAENRFHDGIDFLQGVDSEEWMPEPDIVNVRSPGIDSDSLCSLSPNFKRLRSPGIDFSTTNRMSYRTPSPPGLHYISWRNRFLDSLNVYKFGLRSRLEGEMELCANRAPLHNRLEVHKQEICFDFLQKPKPYGPKGL